MSTKLESRFNVSVSDRPESNPFSAKVSAFSVLAELNFFFKKKKIIKMDRRRRLGFGAEDQRRGLAGEGVRLGQIYKV